MREYRIETLAMLARRAQSRAEQCAHHDRRRRLAAEHIAELRHLVDDLVAADAEEIDEHQLRDRPQPSHRRTRGGTDEGALADRRIEDPTAAKLGQQPFAGTEHVAPGILFALGAHAADDVLAQGDNVGIAFHLLPYRFIERLTE